MSIGLPAPACVPGAWDGKRAVPQWASTRSLAVAQVASVAPHHCALL